MLEEICGWVGAVEITALLVFVAACVASVVRSR